MQEGPGGITEEQLRRQLASSVCVVGRGAGGTGHQAQTSSVSGILGQALSHILSHSRTSCAKMLATLTSISSIIKKTRA